MCVCVCEGEGEITWKSWVTEVLVCMIWFLFTPLSVPGERGMLTDEGRQRSDEALGRGVNELFPQALLLTMRVSIEPLMTGGCSIAHILSSSPPPLFPHIAAHSSPHVRIRTRAHSSTKEPRVPGEHNSWGRQLKSASCKLCRLKSTSRPTTARPVRRWPIQVRVFEWGALLLTPTELE